MRKIRLVAIVVTLMLVVTFASAQDFKDRPNIPALDVEKASFFSIVVDFFATQEFSIVGVDRKCDSTPFNGLQNGFKGFWAVPPGTIFELDGVTVCASGHSFIDVYRQNTLGGNWIPAFEHEDWTYFNCLDDGKYQCIVEVYCCPDKGCNTDADCASGKECLTVNDVDPYLPLRNPSTGSFLDSYNYCEEIQGCTGSDISCWRIGGSNNCEMSSFPCDYPGYPNCPNTWPYTSSSQCQSNLEVNEFCGDGICNNGETCATCPGDCGVCDGNGGGVGGSDIRVIESEVSDIQSTFSLDKVGTFKLTLKNVGDEKGTINVEAGFYSEIYAQEVAGLFSIGFFSIVKDQPNCKPAETFIKTLQVTLDPEESKEIELEVSVKNALVTYLSPGEYSLDTEKIIASWGLYESCCDIQSDGSCAPGTGGYVNEAGTTGRGIMYDYQEIDVKCASFPLKDNIYCDGEKVGSCRGNILNLDKVCSSIASVALETNSSSVDDLLDDFGTIEGDTFQDLKKISLTKKQIETATSADLLASACLSSSECLEEEDDEGNTISSSCIKLDKLKSEGVLTSSEAEGFLADAKETISTTVFGAGVGAATTLTICSISSIPTGGITAIPCTAIGAILGGTFANYGASIISGGKDSLKNLFSKDDELTKAIKAGESSKVGICTVETSFDLGGFVSKIGKSIKITGDATVDGFIILGGGIFLLFLLLGAVKR